MVLGFVLAVILVARLAWRGTAGRRLPAIDAGALKVAAKTTHIALYSLLVAVAVLGVVNSFVRGYNLFDFVSLPQIGDRGLRRVITQWHGLAANVLLGLALLHAAAALVHHYAWRDGLLRRMLASTGTARSPPSQP